MRYTFIYEQRHFHRTQKLCQVMRVSRSGYYEWERRIHRIHRPELRLRTTRQVADELLVDHIRKNQEENYWACGVGRMAPKLRQQGIHTSQRRIHRIMSVYELRAKQARAFKPTTTDSNHAYPVFDNLLGRNFKAAAPNCVWVCDFTYLRVAGRWVYLATVIDLYSRKVVGWNLSESISRELPIAALRMAIRSRKPESGLIHHSDRGSQVREQGVPHGARFGEHDRQYEQERLLRQRMNGVILQHAQGRAGLAV